jgi:hypothetical protein
MLVPHKKCIYEPPRLVTWMAIFIMCKWCCYLIENAAVDLHVLLLRWLYFLYVDDILTSQETHLWTCTACYVDGFTFLYEGYVCTSQERRLETPTAC